MSKRWTAREAALVQCAREGDRAAFDALAAHYRPLLKSLAFVRTGDWAEAEDLAQEVLLRAWQGLPALADPAAFLPWLRAIAARACLSWFRRARPASLSDKVDAGPARPQQRPLEALLMRERERELRQALVTLPEANRTALMMHVWGGYSYEEIAGVTGVRVTTVEGRIHRAKRQLRRLLRDDDAAFQDPARRGPADTKPTEQRRTTMPEIPQTESQDLAQPLALVLFSHQFATLVEAGISLVRTFNILQQAPVPYGEAAQELQERVEHGATVSQVMADRPALFPPFYRGLVRAGEVGGVLEETLRRAADLMTKEWQLSRHRPDGEESLFLVSPRDKPLPDAWAGLTVYQQAVLSVMFCETWAILLRSGVPILQSMETMAGLLPLAQRERLLEARERVRAGDPMNPASFGFLPRFAVELIAVGEENGTLDLTLELAADILEHELECRTMAAHA